MADRYSSFEQLSASEREGVDYQIRMTDRASSIAIIAPHGGWIEPGTSEIAESIAGAEYSFYAFEALQRGAHRDYHITSHKFDEPSALDLVGSCEDAIAIHGRKNTDDDAVWLGGLSTGLRDTIGDALRAAGYPARPNLKFPGLHPTNICNMTAASRGVQLELSRAFRTKLLHDAQELELFCQAVRTALPHTSSRA